MPQVKRQAAEALLGHGFARAALLDEALTHRSAAGAKGRGSNERLEFIGDRVLGLVVAQWLIERFPSEQEGALNRRLSGLVSKTALAGVADAMNLAPLLNVAPGEIRRGVRETPTVLADALEALIGAVFLDAGLEPARAFIHRALAPAMDAQAQPPKDSKTALQEWALARALDLPAYTVTAQSGPSHAPRFSVAVAVAGDAAEAEAGSKRAAEQAAAAILLQRLSA